MADSEPTERPVPVARRRERPALRDPLSAGRRSPGFALARAADVDLRDRDLRRGSGRGGGRGRPLVAKLVSDPAYERAWRYGLFRGSLEAFQRAW